MNQLDPKSLFDHFSWEGEGVEEVGREQDTGTLRVRVNPKFYRPTEVELLIGDPSKAKAKLDWAPKINIEVPLVLIFFCYANFLSLME